MKALIKIGYSYTRLAKIVDLMKGKKTVTQIRSYMERLIFSLVDIDNNPKDISD